MVVYFLLNLGKLPLIFANKTKIFVNIQLRLKD